MGDFTIKNLVDMIMLPKDKYAMLMNEVSLHKDTHQGAYNICKEVENIRNKMEVK